MTKSVLVLFSGGKDSFLTAVRLTKSCDRVVLFSLNNGSVAAEKNLLHGAARLRNRYGEDRITYAGVYCTAAVIQRINKPWLYTAAAELGAKYPSLVNVQVNCLHCQTAMWVSAIAYAKAKRISAVATGYKSCDEFCTGSDPWLSRIRALADANGIEVLLPLWETPEWGADQSFGRNMEMVSEMFAPAVLEPKCLIGAPADKPSPEAETDMAAYFDDCLSPLLQEQIDKLTDVFRYIRLGPESLGIIEYPAPRPEGGVF